MYIDMAVLQGDVIRTPAKSLSISLLDILYKAEIIASSYHLIHNEKAPNSLPLSLRLRNSQATSRMGPMLTLNHFRKHCPLVLNSDMTIPDHELIEKVYSLDLKDALSLAAYIEQLLMTEQQWIMNRFSWLFTSQSFLLTAFVVLLNSSIYSTTTANLLRFALPVLGLFCCVTVALAIRAAERVEKSLLNRRASLSELINTKASSPGLVPKIGSSKALRDHPWTQYQGALPHSILPWAFAILWLLLLVSVRL